MMDFNAEFLNKPPFSEVVKSLQDQQSRLPDQFPSEIRTLVEGVVARVQDNTREFTQDDVDFIRSELSKLKDWANGQIPTELGNFFLMGKDQKLIRTISEVVNHLQGFVQKKQQHQLGENKPFSAGDVQPLTPDKTLAEKWQAGEELPQPLIELRASLDKTSQDIDKAIADSNSSFFVDAQGIEEKLNRELSRVIELANARLQKIQDLERSPSESSETNNLSSLREEANFLAEQLAVLQSPSTEVINKLRNGWAKFIRDLYPQVKEAIQMLRTDRQYVETRYPNMNPAVILNQVHESVQKARNATNTLQGWYRQHIDSLLVFSDSRKGPLLDYWKAWVETNGKIPGDPVLRANQVINNPQGVSNSDLTRLQAELSAIPTPPEQADYINQKVQQLENIKNQNTEREQAEQSHENLLTDLREALNTTLQRNLTISEDNFRVVDEAFEGLVAEVVKMKKNVTERAKEERVRDLERDIYLGWYQKLWENYDLKMDTIENLNKMGLEDMTLMDQHVFPNLKKVGVNLQNLYTEFQQFSQGNVKPEWINIYHGRSTFFVEQAEIIEHYYGARKSLNFTWKKMSTHVILNETRSVPESVNSEDELVINGIAVHELINNGLIEYEHGEKQNVVLGKRRYKRLLRNSDFNLDQNGKRVSLKAGVGPVQTEQIGGNQVEYVIDEFDETAMGFCKRLYDAIYRGDLVLRDSSGNDINVTTIHSSLSLIVDYAYKTVNRVMGANVEAGDDPVVPKIVALRALRLNASVTLHQSDLSNAGTTGTSDPWYYLMHWQEYSEKYFKLGRAKFSRYITEFLFGKRNTNNMGGHPLMSDHRLGAKYIQEVKRVIENDARKVRSNQRLSSHREHERGYSEFHFLGSLPLISPSDVGIGYKVDASGAVSRRVEQRTVESPLSLLTVRDRFATSASDSEGRMVTFDDYRAFGQYRSGKREYAEEVSVENGILVDTTGQPALLEGDEFLYEEMPFQHIDTKFVHEYVMRFYTGPYRVFKEILYSTQSDALSKLTSPDYIKDLRNALTYFVPQVVKIGFRAKYESRAKGLDRAVVNQMIVSLIYAVCIIKSTEQTVEKDRWGQKEIFDYLENLEKNQAISEDEMVLIYAVSVAGRGWELFTQGVEHTLREQVTQLLKFR